MSQPQQMNMNMNMGGMGGPVGGVPPPPQQGAGTPTNGGAVNTNDSAETIKRLNTYIYDYFLRNQHYDIARAMHQSPNMELITQMKQSPNQRQNQPNGVDDTDSDRPKDLPEAQLNNTEGPFLQDWWFQFWDIYNSRRNMPGKQSTLSYLTTQRAGQKQRTNLMTNGMDPAAMQNMRAMSMMGNGMMQNDLKKAAMQNAGAGSMNPQQMAQMQRMRAQQGQQQMMQGQPMERSASQLEMNGPRSGSPGSGDAPSPKRQRLDGNVQQMGPRPGQQGQMPNSQVGPDPSSLVDPSAANQTRELLAKHGIDPSTMPSEQFNLIAIQPTNVQRKSVDLYSHQMQQSAMNAMNQAKSNMNKGMPPNVSAAMGPAGAQGSPMSQAGMDASLAEFQANGAMRPGMVPGAPVNPGAPGAPNSGGNHALQDYQMQLMLLEQQNKKRLLMARQEQDIMSAPGMPAGNGQFAPNMSPQGSRAGGPSPNPNDMARGTPKMQPGASPNGQMPGRVSPAPGFDPNQIPPNMRNQMVMGPNGVPMPRSHPQYSHQLTQAQVEMLNARNQMMPNGTFPGPAQPMPPNMMPGPPGGPQQPGLGPPNMTPRQGNQAMPPPPAPQQNAAGGTQPSSPAPAPAPPTPNQSNKAKPGAKKDNKNTKKSATKKGGQTGATPASEAEQPPTPTPATPITPMNQNSFQKQQIAPNGGMPNGAQQQQPPNQQPNQGGNGVQGPVPDMNGPFGGSGSLVGDDQFGMGSMEFADVSGGSGGDVLDNFDFDSFLNTDDMNGGMAGFDNFSFDTGLEAGGDGLGQ